ncbi:MAG: hypothetical protein KUG50_03230, partial [Cycloclasticus sp.]|nr:hypothetical protein [Cycloclasticus sp.]
QMCIRDRYIVKSPFTKIEPFLGYTQSYLTKLSPEGYSNDYAIGILVLVFYLFFSLKPSAH